jgi:hypothetical protein
VPCWPRLLFLVPELLGLCEIRFRFGIVADILKCLSAMVVRIRHQFTIFLRPAEPSGDSPCNRALLAVITVRRDQLCLLAANVISMLLPSIAAFRYQYPQFVC